MGPFLAIGSPFRVLTPNTTCKTRIDNPQLGTSLVRKMHEWTSRT